jgi:hypothetical protein
MELITAVPQALEARAFLTTRGVFDPDLSQITAADEALRAAQAVVETGTRRLIGARQMGFSTHVAGARWWFPVCPIAAVTAVTWSQDGRVFSPLGAEAYFLEDGKDEPVLNVAGLACGVRLKITAQAGGDAPVQMMQAVRLLAGEWFDAGLSIDPFNAPSLSFGVRALMSQVRYARPMEWAAR